VADPATTWSLWGWRVVRTGLASSAARVACVHCDYTARQAWRLVTSNVVELSLGAPVGGMEMGGGGGGGGGQTRARRASQWFSVISEGDAADIAIRIDGTAICRRDVLLLLSASANLCRPQRSLSSASHCSDPDIRSTSADASSFAACDENFDAAWSLCLNPSAPVGLLPRHVIMRPFAIVAASEEELTHAVCVLLLLLLLLAAVVVVVVIVRRPSHPAVQVHSQPARHHCPCDRACHTFAPSRSARWAPPRITDDAAAADTRPLVILTRCVQATPSSSARSPCPHTSTAARGHLLFLLTSILLLFISMLSAKTMPRRE
jgi:hypothetical protein